ncbi:MAG: nucleotidyltransferase family protein [Acidimicrobiia bacterium]|nr:nucleotidyltransferase family protein [Acidimicrobiia bacterium]
MEAGSPSALAVRLAEVFEELGIPYALGGSLASSLLGEPRTTVDVDIAVRLDVVSGESLLERVGGELYVSLAAAREAIRVHSSFNLVDTGSALKVDLFVLGDGLLDRMQLGRRVRIQFPGTESGIWVTSAEDQVLRKLDWFRRSGGTSERQWRDVVGILRVHADSMDIDYMSESAAEVGLGSNLDAALREARPSGPSG